MTSGRSFSTGLVGEKPLGLFPILSAVAPSSNTAGAKVVWDLIAGLVRQGHTADAGIDRIYAVYGGQTSVTNIIAGLKRDKKNGTLSPNLKF